MQSSAYSTQHKACHMINCHQKGESNGTKEYLLTSWYQFLCLLTSLSFLGNKDSTSSLQLSKSLSIIPHQRSLKESMLGRAEYVLQEQVTVVWGIAFSLVIKLKAVRNEPCTGNRKNEWKKMEGRNNSKKKKKSGNANTGPHAYRANIHLKFFLYYKTWTRLHPKARLFLTSTLDPFKMCGLMWAALLRCYLLST